MTAAQPSPTIRSPRLSPSSAATQRPAPAPTRSPRLAIIPTPPNSSSFTRRAREAQKALRASPLFATHTQTPGIWVSRRSLFAFDSVACALSLLESALAKNSLVTPLECALTKNTGGWGYPAKLLIPRHCSAPVAQVSCSQSLTLPAQRGRILYIQ